jgi:hypothetical protein
VTEMTGLWGPMPRCFGAALRVLAGGEDAVCL